jgi:competence protein ComEC
MIAARCQRSTSALKSHTEANQCPLPDLFERFSVGAVYVSPVMFRTETAALTALKASIAAAGVPLKQISAADQFQSGSDCRIRVLHPPREGVPASDNANSVVLSIEYRGRRVLLTGDLAPPGLARLLDSRPLACDAILVPHHGSATSDPHGLCAWSRPGFAVLSSGYFDDVAATSRAYALGGAKVLNLASSGAVSLQIDGNRLAVSSWRQGPLTR